MSNDPFENEPSTPEQPSGPDGAPQQKYRNVLLHQFLWIFICMMLAYTYLESLNTASAFIPYSQFKTELKRDNVEQLSVKGEALQGRFRNLVNWQDQKGVTRELMTFRTYVPSFGDPELSALLEQQEVTLDTRSTQQPFWVSAIVNILPWLLIILFFVYSSRIVRSSMGSRGPMLGFGRSKARRFVAGANETRFTDVAGLENAKADLQEIIDFLKEPDRYRELGAKIPRGILMMGPPGSGKTLLARATAGEAGVPFFSVSGSEFIEMFVGVGASRVRDMFAQAREAAPALIFIDEIDSVGRSRGTGLGGGNDEREQTLNQILAEMDGFASEEAVVVLAATNRPDVLDTALLRPGRFDRKLVLELPQRNAREQILKVHSRNVPLADDVDLAAIAAETVGFSGADLENLVNEGALNAARARKQEINNADMEAARDKIVLGNETSELLSGEEKHRVACHEAGHALAAHLLPGADPLKRITIIPRGRSLGMTEQMPAEERHNYTQDYLENRIVILLGGRCAEKLIFDNFSSGAANDLKQATDLARQMVSQWGMSERVGPVNFQQSEEHPFLGREIAIPKNFSDASVEMIDLEVTNLIKTCEAKTSGLLSENRDKLSSLAEALLKSETLDETEIAALLD